MTNAGGDVAVVDDHVGLFRDALDGFDVHVDGVEADLARHTYEEVGVGETATFALVEHLLRGFVRQPVVGDRHAGVIDDRMDDRTRLVAVGEQILDRLDGEHADFVVDVVGDDDLLHHVFRNAGAEIRSHLGGSVLFPRSRRAGGQGGERGDNP